MSVSQRIKAYCEARGSRYPIKKVLVADHLEQAGNFIEADMLYLLLRNASVSVSSATVYQSLNWLIENGFAECKVMETKNFYRILDQEKSVLSQNIVSVISIFEQ